MKWIRKNGLKIILDILMAILLALMYNKRVLGMSFHEIGGLALCGLFLIHKAFNWKWIRSVSKGLFSRKTPARQRVYWVLDLLLFACFAYILVSGILISKVVFPGAGGGGSFKMGHYAAAALALALTGIHVGLHFSWIGQRMGFLKKLPLWLRRGLAIALSLAVLVFGGLQLTSTSFVSWLSNIGVVFGASQSMPSGAPAFSEVSGNSGEQTATETDASMQGVAVADTSSADTTVAASDATTADASQTAADSAEITHTGGKGPGSGQMGGHGEGGGESVSVVSVLGSFLSILFAFAVAAGWTDALLKSRKRKRLLQQALHEKLEAPVNVAR